MKELIVPSFEDVALFFFPKFINEEEKGNERKAMHAVHDSERQLARNCMILLHETNIIVADIHYHSEKCKMSEKV